MYLLEELLSSEFKCIADKCTYSCCSNWAISFDNAYYKSLMERGETDIANIAERFNENEIRMKLTPDGNCPYLCESGLCNLIIKYGEEALSSTCTNFPRSIKRKNDCYEYALSNACPAMIDILDKTPTPIIFDFNEIDDNWSQNVNSYEGLVSSRNLVIDIMQNKDFPIWTRLYMISSLAHKIVIASDDCDKLADEYNSEDFLNSLYKKLKELEYDISNKFQNAYELFNVIGSMESMDIHEQYCVNLYKQLENIEVELLKNGWHEFQVVMEKYDDLIENVAVNHIFLKTDCISKEYFKYSLLELLEEIAMIRITWFLDWLYNEKSELPDNYKMIICYFARRIEHANTNVLIEWIKKMELRGKFDNAYMYFLVR